MKVCESKISLLTGWFGLLTKDSPRPQYKVRESEFDGRPELCVETSVDQGVEESADQGEPLYEGHHLGVGAAAPRTK